MLVATGAAAFRFVVLTRLSGEGAADVALRAAHRAARLGMAAALAAFVAGLARLPLQVLDIRDPDASLWPQARALVLHTTWGPGWAAQLALAALAAFAYARARAGRDGAWVVAAAASLLLALTPAFSGHAFGSERMPGLAVVADSVHVLAAGAWLGALLVLATALALPRSEGQGHLAGALVAAFSPLALSAAAAAAATGVISAKLHLGPVSALWQSRYGRTLLVKLSGVGLMAACGFYNWKKARPRLQQHGDVGPIRGSILAELIVGALVLVATAVLVGTPPPGEE